MDIKMNKVKEKLNNIIRERGLNSKEALRLSKELDTLIVEHHKDNEEYKLGM